MQFTGKMCSGTNLISSPLVEVSLFLFFADILITNIPQIDSLRTSGCPAFIPTPILRYSAGLPAD
jgi:hypothetical protein